MAQVELTWIEAQRFLGVDSGKHSVVLSAAEDVGVKPAESLLLALAACAGYDIVAILRKQRLELRRLTISVDAEQAPAPPRAFQRIELLVRAAAAGLRHEQLTRATDLALNKYCSVRASLHPAISVSFTVAVED